MTSHNITSISLPSNQATFLSIILKMKKNIGYNSVTPITLKEIHIEPYWNYRAKEKPPCQDVQSKRCTEGETYVIDNLDNLIPRPKSKELKNLLSVLEETGISIKRSSFDAISHPSTKEIDFTNMNSIRDAITAMVFVEIKSANQYQVKEDFTGYFLH